MFYIKIKVYFSWTMLFQQSKFIMHLKNNNYLKWFHYSWFYWGLIIFKPLRPLNLFFFISLCSSIKQVHNFNVLLNETCLTVHRRYSVRVNYFIEQIILQELVWLLFPSGSAVSCLCPPLRKLHLQFFSELCACLMVLLQIRVIFIYLFI